MAEQTIASPVDRHPAIGSAAPAVSSAETPRDNLPQGGAASRHASPPGTAPGDVSAARLPHDPAVTLSPSLIHLAAGTRLSGRIAGRDSDNRPILETPEGRFALDPDAGLQQGDTVDLTVSAAGRAIEATLASRNGVADAPSLKVQLLLLATADQTEAAVERLTSGAVTYAPAASVPPENTAEEQALQAALAMASLTRTDAAGPLRKDAAAQQSVEGRTAGSLLLANAEAAEDGRSVRFLARVVLAEPSSPLAPLASELAVTLLKPGAPVPAALSGISQGLLKATVVDAASLAPARIGADGEILPERRSGSGLYLKIGGTVLSLPPAIAGTVRAGEVVSLTVNIRDVTPGAFGHEPVMSMEGRAISAASSSMTFSGLPAPPVGGNVRIAIWPPDTPADTPAGVPASREPGGPMPAQALSPAELEKMQGKGLLQRGEQVIRTPVGLFAIRPNVPFPPGSTLTVTVKAEAALPGAGTAEGGIVNQAAATTTATATATGQAQSSGPKLLSRPYGGAPVPATSSATTARDPAASGLPLFAGEDGWPALDALLAAASQLPPQVQALLQQRLPKLDSSFPSALLFFLAATGKGSVREWLGDDIAGALERRGHHALLGLLENDLGKIPAKVTDAGGAEWRPVLLPLLTDQGAQPLCFLFRHFEAPDREDGRNGTEKEEGRPKGTRFLLELQFSELGGVQIDGLVRKRRLDLIVRSEGSFTERAKSDLLKMFQDALSGLDYDGALRFEERAAFSLSIPGILKEHMDTSQRKA